MTRNRSSAQRSPRKPAPGAVFVSYDHADRAAAQAIVDYLAERNLDVWWDDLISPGAEWGTVLTEKLSEAACVVVIWSRHSVESIFVRAEVRWAFDRLHTSGRIVPVLLDADASRTIPLPFGELQYLDLTTWDAKSRAPLRRLGTIVRRLAMRPRRGDEGGSSLADAWATDSARRAAVELRDLTRRVGSIGELLLGDERAVLDIRVALGEVHKTLDVVSDAVASYLAGGLPGKEVDAAPYLRLERGLLTKRIRDGRGHCDLIARHYGRRGGLREWLERHTTRRTLQQADRVFGRLSQADGDLFAQLAEIGSVITDDSRAIVNLLITEQVDLARGRIVAGRRRLASLERELHKSLAALQDAEHRLGFAAAG